MNKITEIIENRDPQVGDVYLVGLGVRELHILTRDGRGFYLLINLVTGSNYFTGKSINDLTMMMIDRCVTSPVVGKFTFNIGIENDE